MRQEIQCENKNIKCILHINSDPVTAFHFAMSVGAKHQYLAEVSLHLTGLPETIQKMDCELRQVGSASYSDGP